MPAITTKAEAVSSEGESPQASEAFKQALLVLEKKVRNLVKRQSKLDNYRERLDKGQTLNQDQQDAVMKYEEVINKLEFARELLKTFTTLNEDVEKDQRKSVRREQQQREELERQRLRVVLEVQIVLDGLGEGALARVHFLSGTNGAVQLQSEDLSNLDEIYRLINPEREDGTSFGVLMEKASRHLWDLLEGKDKKVGSTTYKHLKTVLDKIRDCGYFARVRAMENGITTEETMLGPAEELDVQTNPEEVSEVVDREVPLTTPEPEPEPEAEPALPSAEVAETEAIDEFDTSCQPCEVEHLFATYLYANRAEITEFVNTRYLADNELVPKEPEETVSWSSGPKPSPALQADMATPSSMPVVTETSLQDTAMRRQKLHDLMAQMQGTFNFMQESMLEYDSSLDSATIAARQMSPVDLLESTSITPTIETRGRQPDIPQQPANQPSLDPTTANDVYVAPQPHYQSAPSPKDVSQAPHNIVQAPITLASDPVATQSHVFSPSAVKPLGTGGINVNAAPFQSMQTPIHSLHTQQVFTTASLSHTNDTDAIKQPMQFAPQQYQPSYSPQPSTALTPQPSLEQDSFQTVGNNAVYQAQPDGLGVSNQPMPGLGFSRAQIYYNSRAPSRGVNRGMRGATNGYRQTNGFRGGRGGTFNGAFDGYHGGYPSASSTGYGQGTFGTREYGMNYHQRDGNFQQSFKRGNGPASLRAPPRGGHGGSPPIKNLLNGGLPPPQGPMILPVHNAK
uniref:caprin-1-like isoform X4 n=1 Tax=Myxine glutinosa TaxID=7769 RepID=UPI00358E2423